jgi:cephalosporin hydroxylase
MIIVDKDKVIISKGNKEKITYNIGSKEAFSILSKLWLRSGWETKYDYSFTWLGRPIVQLPEDMFRIQEVIYTARPDVVIETGIAHGGSLIFYASLCKAMNQGRVIGIDIEIRPHNRKAIQEHELFEYITLVEGSSIDEKVVNRVKGMVKPGDRGLVVLDSNHSKQHVLAELNAYSCLVAVDSYIVACDGIMESLAGAPRSSKDWVWNNPKAAAEEFVKNRDDFTIVEPEFRFNEGLITERVTYWPGAFLRRKK